MTKKDFFRIFIKLFGLYGLIVTIFQFIPSQVSYLSFVWKDDLIVGILTSSMILIVLLAYYLLIRNTEKIVNFLKLGEGYDSLEIKLDKISDSTILKLGVIIIGGLLLIENFPSFLHYCFLAFKKEVSTNGLTAFEGKVDYFWWILSGINCIVGYLLITQFKAITKYLLAKKS